MDETTAKIRAAFAPCSLGEWPTPLEAAPALADAVGVDALWIKREDRSSSRGGGNKTRALEFLLSGRAPGTVCVTVGGTGSTHCLATVRHARALNLRTVIAHFPQFETAVSRATAHATAAAADLVVRASSRVGLPVALYRAWGAAGRMGPRCWIPGGGAHPRAVVGQFLGGLELARQVSQPPEAIVVALGSSGTAAGLTLAMAWLGWPTRVVGVRVAGWPLASAWRARRLARGAAALLAAVDVPFPHPSSPFPLEVVDGLGAGYGYPTPAGEQAQALAAAHGLTLDPTYTAKAFAAIPRIGYRRVVFWHTFAT